MYSSHEVVDRSASANITEWVDAPFNEYSLYSSYLLAPGDHFFGAISYYDDADTIAVDLVAGQTYTFAVDALSSGEGTLNDPTLVVSDPFGIVVDYSDDRSWVNLDPELTMTASVSGTYHMVVVAFDPWETGTYEVNVTQSGTGGSGGNNSIATVGTLDQMATFLTDGFWTRASFDTSDNNQLSVNITALTAEGQQLARWALEAWEMVANLDFVEVSGSAEITFDDNQPGAFAGADTIIGDTVFNGSVNISVAWVEEYGATIDSYNMSTYIHEIAHVLGLGHQGQYDGNAVYGQDETFINDSYQLSIMSYFSQSDNTTVDADYADPITAMMVDIIAIQNLYGAPDANSATAGDTVWGIGSNLGGYLDDYFASLGGANLSSVEGGLPVALTVYDRDGIDTFDLSFSNAGDNIDLRAMSISDVGGLIGNIAIARGTFLENLIAGDGSDTIVGNNINNEIFANDGNDWIVAGGGYDSVSGGEGNDTIFGENGLDYLFGNAGNDSINGGAGDDTMWGGAGSDVLSGGDGDDRLGGGSWHDTVSGDAGNDTIFAGLGNDVVRGGTGEDRIFSGSGYDTIEGGEGNDRSYGGIGNDLISGDAGNDVLGGYAGNDTVNGGAGSDTIFGGDGDDLLDGGAWVDTIYAGQGNDTLMGGDGGDTFLFYDFAGDDQITDFDVFEADVLGLDAELWTGTLTAQEVVNQLASVTSGHVVFNFDDGDSLTLLGLGTTTGLADVIDIL